MPRPPPPPPRHVPGNRQPRTDRQVAERAPAVVGQERMVGGRLDLLSRSQPQPEYVLAPAREDMGQPVCAVSEPFVQGPHRDIARSAGPERSEEHTSEL